MNGHAASVRVDRTVKTVPYSVLGNGVFGLKYDEEREISPFHQSKYINAFPETVGRDPCGRPPITNKRRLLFADIMSLAD